MKTNHYFFFCIAMLVFLGCNREEPIEVRGGKVDKVESESFVSIDFVERHVSKQLSEARVKGSANYSIEAVVNAESDTLMYIVNYGRSHGWQILSADARVPAVLAEGESGFFSLEEGSPALQVWLDCLKRDMSLIRSSRDEDLKFSSEEIAQNKVFWFGDSPRQQLPPEEDLGGMWVVSTQSETITVKEVDHMVPKWDQDTPYNEYCPLQTNSQTDRCPVGCVAVAGSQVLKFLHDTLGVPTSVPSHCTMNGNSPSFSNYSSTVWNYMSYSYLGTSTDSVAVLLSHVGHLAGMHYNNDYSWALPANLRTDVINYYGISCSHGSYNEGIVKSSLESGMPVIVTATDLLIPVDFDIHTFVIDGYKKTYIKYTHHHYWQPDDPDIIADPELYPDYYTYSYTSPDITAIKINWGWWTQWVTTTPPNSLVQYPLNDGWYSLTDDWVTVHSDGTSESWNYNRQMIYGFSVQE